MQNKNTIKNTLKNITLKKKKQKKNITLKNTSWTKSTFQKCKVLVSKHSKVNPGVSSTLLKRVSSQSEYQPHLTVVKYLKEKSPLTLTSNKQLTTKNLNQLKSNLGQEPLYISTDKNFRTEGLHGLTDLQRNRKNSKGKLATGVSYGPVFTTKTTLKRKFVHPNNYVNVLGYRTNKIVVNPKVTLQGIRRVLHYLKKVAESKSNQSMPKAELIIVLDSAFLNSLACAVPLVGTSQPLGHKRLYSDGLITGFGTTENSPKTSPKKEKGYTSKLQMQSFSQKEESTQKTSKASDLLAYSLLRLQQGVDGGYNVEKEHGPLAQTSIKLTLKSSKDTLSYLSSLNKNTTSFYEGTHVSKGSTLCGVLMLNPAKSLLGSLADSVFNQTTKNTKKVSTSNAIGFLCAKKGIPLISLCDVASSTKLCTYPIVCDTRNFKSIYLIFDLLIYGINKI